MKTVKPTNPDWVGIKAGGDLVDGKWVPNGESVICAEFYPPKGCHYVVLATYETEEEARAALPDFLKWERVMVRNREG